MDVRMDYAKAFPEGYRAMSQLERAVRESGLEPVLLELVKTRASQLNGCAFCIDMHTKNARAKGETEQRLYALSAWRVALLFPARQLAAELPLEGETDPYLLRLFALDRRAGSTAQRRVARLRATPPRSRGGGPATRRAAP